MMAAVRNKGGLCLRSVAAGQHQDALATLGFKRAVFMVRVRGMLCVLQCR